MVTTRSMSVERGDSPPPQPRPQELESAVDLPVIDERVEVKAGDGNEPSPPATPRVDKGKGRAIDDDAQPPDDGSSQDGLRGGVRLDDRPVQAGTAPTVQADSQPDLIAKPKTTDSMPRTEPPNADTLHQRHPAQTPLPPPPQPVIARERPQPPPRQRPDLAAAAAPGIGNWMMEIPPVTRAWVVASVGTSVAVQCKVISFTQLYLSWRLVLDRGQLWRLVSTFCFFGELSFELAFHLFFVMRYSRLLEEADFAGNKADYVVMLVFNATILLLLTSMLSLPFLASSLAFSVVYIWGRRNPHVRLSVFGLITITAPYLPATLLIFSLFLNDPTSTRATEAAIGDALGLIAGHVYFFFMDVWPRELYYPFIDGKKEQEKARGIIRAPRWLHHLLGDDPTRW